MGSILGLVSSGHLVALWLLCIQVKMGSVGGIGVNWGTQATHPLPPSTVVGMLKDNGFQKVKLFDADSDALNALSNTGIQVMVGIPNDLLNTLANSMEAAENWVAKNVSSHISTNGVDIRYVAVGNEPFLSTYNGSFLGTTLPALQNIQAALIKAGLSTLVKVTVPLNADVYETSTDLPSGGDFRADIHDLINSSAINDGGTIYKNVFDANHDTLVWALQKNGYENLSIIIGEIGWPTDGDKNANLKNAQQFNQGFMNRIIAGQGTPLRPGPLDAYLFSLVDEDAKSIQPAQQWCIMSPSASLDDPQVEPSVNYACANADCTALGYGTSCGNLDARGNISYAFNSYYQQNNQLESACQFPNVSVITNKDPSTGDCKFRIMIKTVTSGVGLRSKL
ncbi:hypothetical protein GH714_011785 [Hevea brasiliensis]|uniref:glucan endo-1,3-beta-D-glucosidase n=1 Tax=Hevea brasiliensis TaxID=3981 RepID=A0A6A6MML4_HEVBR|nr:hypothetical protein GH714_011785 [Hevea brasiliensis]